MSNTDYQMQTIADYAIKLAKERFGQELDYTEQSIVIVDNILRQIYSDISNQVQTDEIKKLLNDTAVVWGSYLGSYMCRKWGGTWMIKGQERTVFILNIEFSPISFIYQKLTSHPEYSVEIYLFETKKLIYLSVINPQPTQSLPNNIGQIKEDILTSKAQKDIPSNKPPAKIPTSTIQNQKAITQNKILGSNPQIEIQSASPPKEIQSPSFQSRIPFIKSRKEFPIFQSLKIGLRDKRVVTYIAASVGIFLIIIACYFGYKIIKGNFEAYGLLSSKASETPHVEITPISATPYLTSTQQPTVTTLPTYTPKPSFTIRPSSTPFFTPTRKATLTSSPTQTPITPTPTVTLRKSPTSKPFDPTETPAPPPEKPSPTPTIPEPVVLESCDIDPSSVPVNTNVSLTFIAHFSGHSKGYSFDTSFDPDQIPNQSGCTGVDADGDGLAYCDGSSGEVPEPKTVYVTFSSSVGECVASYTSR